MNGILLKVIGAVAQCQDSQRKQWNKWHVTALSALSTNHVRMAHFHMETSDIRWAN